MCEIPHGLEEKIEYECEGNGMRALRTAQNEVGITVYMFMCAITAEHVFHYTLHVYQNFEILSGSTFARF